MLIGHCEGQDGIDTFQRLCCLLCVSVKERVREGERETVNYDIDLSFLGEMKARLWT